MSNESREFCLMFLFVATCNALAAVDRISFIQQQICTEYEMFTAISEFNRTSVT